MAELPRELAEGIDRLLEGLPARDLRRASGDLSARYRQKQERRAPVARSEAEIVAYAATRLPATFAAVSSVLGAVRDLRPNWQPRTLLDLGAGPGTATWSAAEIWPALDRAVAVEAEPRMIALGQDLARSTAHPSVRTARWVRGSVADRLPDGSYDLVILAYVLGELDSAARDLAVDQAARATAAPDGCTVIVEPGTPEGSARIRHARGRLIEGGGFVTAPCPQDAPCPIATPDWCHFSVRLARTAAHRAAKLADLGYEDEKFAYVAVSRQPTDRAQARVLRHPQIRPRVVNLALCTSNGIQSLSVPKSDRERFRLARKVPWGGVFPYTNRDHATDSPPTP